jgi:uroporphyrin-III C-methyltransferase/precorrin-2 dehydrogenase/sirohydrochlorin ferrochelatase
MRYFPVFIDLQGQEVLLVGAGSVAERKARMLLRAGARIRVVARQLSPRFERWQAEGVVRHVAREYAPCWLENVFLVFAATSDAALNQQVFQDAEARRVMVNVVDDAARCRFISPAVVDRSPVQVAISTGGNSPVVARWLRNCIERLLPLGLGQVVEAAGALRSTVKRRLRLPLRRSFWEWVLDEEQMSAWSLQSRAAVTAGLTRQLERYAAAHHAVGPTRAASSPGVVYLVGAGPGRPDLLTLRALHVLSRADVILHDSLVSDEVLDLARRDADRIDVGKRAGGHQFSQQAIHDLMLQHARQGRTVVRLKGGDAFIFGRGGEELEFLQAHGQQYEVVPGITAALGCAAYAGIPLTHRDHAQVVSLVTGHLSAQAAEEPDHERLKSGCSAGQVLDWRTLVGPGRTAVIYMGVRQAEHIRHSLLEAGVAADLPVALVADGTTDRQRVVHGTVQSLPELAGQVSHASPGLLIIGQVASLGSTLGWFNPVHELRSAA